MKKVLLPLDVLLQDALVHDNEDARVAGFFRRFLVDHAFLHRDDGRVNLDGLLYHFRDSIGPAKDVHDVNLVGNIEQRR